MVDIKDVQNYKVIDFVGKKNLWFILSIMILVVFFGITFAKYLKTNQFFNFGIDFTGGTTMIVQVDKITEINGIADLVNKKSAEAKFLSDTRGILNGFDLEKSEIQFSAFKGDNLQAVLIKSTYIEPATRTKILAAMQEKFGKCELLEADNVGPSMGKQLAKQAIILVLISNVFLLIYIGFRFDFAFGFAAIIALLHDALTTLGFAGVFGLEVNATFVVAILTILGYSINDTIVVFDRVRENFPVLKNKYTIEHITNLSITQTLARSINTVVTVLLTLFAIYFFGGETTKHFALVLIFGIASGVYSTLFIASPLFTILKKWQDGEE